MPYYYNDLKPTIKYENNLIESPILGDNNFYHVNYVIDNVKYPIEIHKSTFIYINHYDNLICKDNDDKELLNEIFNCKRESRMGNDNSEDALTWNVFRSIEKNQDIDLMLTKMLGFSVTNSRIIYWSYDSRTNGNYKRLVDARNMCHENFKSGTEPDLIIECDQAIISIEAKFTSSNKTSKDDLIVLQRYQNNNKYFKLFKKDMRMISMKEFKIEKYELARNWLLGEYLRENKKFVLVNLVREEAEKNIESVMNDIAITDENHCFVRATWEWIYSFCKTSQNNYNNLLYYFENKTIGYSNEGLLKKAFNL